MNKQIQWFPGHMQKTLRQFLLLKKEFNLIILMLDARAPKSSFIESFSQLLKDKKVIVCLNKSDFVPSDEIKKWENYYKKIFLDAFAISLKENKSNNYQKLLSFLKKHQKKDSYTKVIIIGIPNVGKSSFLNFLLTKKSAKVQNIAGVTKDLNWYQKEKFLFLDTPGVLVPKFDSDLQGVKLILIGAIKINIVPLETVIELMFEIFKAKNILLPFASFLDFQNKIKEEKEQTKFSLKLISDYQKGKFGKFILD
ncbi:MAG: ribosome biogenesis GTPase A [Candidatus Hepatoplasma scabrum]|nr:MAG: ribosome biogenesis GTPase A [Candidatus Hepatoplasma sp.]